MGEITTDPAQYGDTSNTLLLKIATLVQGGAGGGGGAPFSLAFTTQPGNAVAGQPFGTQPVVTVRDSGGNTVTGYTGNVTMEAHTGGGTLSGTLVVPAVAGVATFTDLQTSNAETGYSLQTSITELDPQLFISAPFDVAAADPLAGFNWAARLQTHNGNNVPLGLWQDVTMLVPATMDGDPIAAWSDELSDSGIVAIQSDEQKQPILFFEDGVPTVLPDGVDDEFVFTLSNSAGKGSIFIGQRADSPTQLSVILASSNTVITLWTPFIGIVYFDWGDRVSQATTLSGWNVLEFVKDTSVPAQYIKVNGSTLSSGSGTTPGPANSAFSLLSGSGFHFSGGVTSFMLSNDNLISNETTVNGYLATLNP